MFNCETQHTQGLVLTSDIIIMMISTIVLAMSQWECLKQSLGQKGNTTYTISDQNFQHFMSLIFTQGVIIAKC